MKQISKTMSAIALLLLAISPTQAAPGYETMELKVAHRERSLPLHIWYPAMENVAATMLGKNIVFTGIEVRMGAKPQQGEFPVVLLSHGSGGNAVNIGWIAAHLADQGMIVVSTNHPGTTSRDSLPRETVKIWQRTADFSAILDFLETKPPHGLKPDLDRVSAVGFSLGGYTVLGLAGARVSKQKYVDYCLSYPHFLDCAWYAAAGVNLANMNAEKFGQSNLDKRIKTVVAVDPGLAQAFTSKSLGEIQRPVLIVNLGSLDEVPAGIDGADIVLALAHSEFARVEGATHFSFLGECTAMGEAIIKVEGDEPICSEISDRKRSDIHNELKGLIAAYLKKHR
ncbi:MAG: dienelactone hydrolase [Hyphomicrobiales bacterium]|nr:MAG: dienelactone hydrolase [Hyphomicrobiales bacterium]